MTFETILKIRPSLRNISKSLQLKSYVTIRTDSIQFPKTKDVRHDKDNRIIHLDEKHPTRRTIFPYNLKIFDTFINKCAPLT